ncbi:MAG: hypothetical protein MUE36_13475 [Acidimicrobiales bacterium]|jgi:hypothetical protein|nr:hypothetical protein [Acidimicrobiales bacterium]
MASRIVIGGLSLSATFTMVAVLAAGEQRTEAPVDTVSVPGPTGTLPVAATDLPPLGPPATTIVIRRHYVTSVPGASAGTPGAGPSTGAVAAPGPSAAPGAPAPAPAAAVPAPAPRPTAPPVAATRAS